MHLVRLLYFSENRLAGGSPMLGHLQELQRVSAANNAARGLTGALAFDDLWFLQALEGERTTVWSTFRAILEDPRHDDVTLVSCIPIADRLFGAWAMRLVMATGDGLQALAAFRVGGILRPELMSSDEFVDALGALIQSERSPSLPSAEAKKLREAPRSAAVAP